MGSGYTNFPNSKYDTGISEEVNQAIGLGPGRIDRDEWVLQAKRLIR